MAVVKFWCQSAMLKRYLWACLLPTLSWANLMAPQLQAQGPSTSEIAPTVADSEAPVESPYNVFNQSQQTVEENPASALAEWMRGLKTLEATVVQRVFANGNLVEESRGHFAMSPPLLLWQVYEPFPQTLLLDKERLQIYDEDLGQLSIQLLSNISGPMPADLLMKPDQLINGDYTITREVLGNDHTYRLVPTASSSLFQALDIVLAEDLLAALVIYDWRGQQTHLLFESVVLNQPLSPARFELVVPEGTDVIRG